MVVGGSQGEEELGCIYGRTGSQGDRQTHRLQAHPLDNEVPGKFPTGVIEMEAISKPGYLAQFQSVCSSISISSVSRVIFRT